MTKILALCVFAVSLFGCVGEKCLPNKGIGDVVIVTKDTYGANSRHTFNKMIEAAQANDTPATIDMILAGQLRCVDNGMRGSLVDKDGTRALVHLPDDNGDWWIASDFLK